MPVGVFEKSHDLLLADSLPRTTDPKKPGIYLDAKGVQCPPVSAERPPVHRLLLHGRVRAIFLSLFKEVVNNTVTLAGCADLGTHPAHG